MIMNETETRTECRPQSLSSPGTESLDHILWDDYSYRYNCEQASLHQAKSHQDAHHIDWLDD